MSRKPGSWRIVRDVVGRPVRAWSRGKDVVVWKFRASFNGYVGLIHLRAQGNMSLFRNINDVFAPGEPLVPIMKALKTPGTSWWVGSSGALERVATIYEERTSEAPPYEGWRLVSAEEASRLTAERRSTGERLPSELDEAMRLANNAKRLARLEARVEAARLSVKRYERRVKLATTLLGKWTSKLTRSENALRKAKGVRRD